MGFNVLAALRRACAAGGRTTTSKRPGAIVEQEVEWNKKNKMSKADRGRPRCSESDDGGRPKRADKKNRKSKADLGRRYEEK